MEEWRLPRRLISLGSGGSRSLDEEAEKSSAVRAEKEAVGLGTQVVEAELWPGTGLRLDLLPAEGRPGESPLALLDLRPPVPPSRLLLNQGPICPPRRPPL